MGLNVSRLRRQRGLSQERLAELAGTNHKQIGRVERGEGNVSVGSLAAIAAALAVSISEFFEGSPVPVSTPRFFAFTDRQMEVIDQALVLIRKARRAARRRS
ncbi:MAG TPA: helix-turn-helix domain-containing protein [Vicinamibacterales bacterium]|nr:helix-turn-helix domain-containing protein [Vicinamibacterales bacterium]